MAKQEESNPQETIETLKARGLSCKRLDSMVKNKMKDAKDFRQAGFVNLANKEEESARAISGLKKKVCLLK